MQLTTVILLNEYTTTYRRSSAINRSVYSGLETKDFHKVITKINKCSCSGVLRILYKSRNGKS